MHPTIHARTRPDHPAIIMAGSGTTVSFAEMEDAANRIARLLRARGVAAGDTVGLWLENRPEFLEVAWATQRSGVRLVPISTHLTPAEVAYILEDSEAKLLLSSTYFAPRLPSSPSCCRTSSSWCSARMTSATPTRRLRRCPAIRCPTRARGARCSTAPAPPGGPRAFASTPFPTPITPSARR
jgi:acyl-CoA synthetase (AMP-forming)/AMP-acid ligase II